MSDKLRWGLLSTANINQALIGPLRKASRSELVAVGSRNRVKAKAYALANDIPRSHGSYEALLADPEIDAIYISLPNALHCEWTVKAAEAGKHVLCEKPIVTSLAELDQVEAAADAHGVVVFEAFMYLHHPQTRHALELIRSGEIGQIQMVNSWFHFYLPPENSSNIRLSADLVGGSIWDVGVYPNSMAITMTGGDAPDAVYANQVIGETGVDVLTNGQLHFANGAVGQISSGLRQPGRAGAFIVGDAGIIQLDAPWKPDLSGPNGVALTRRDGTSELFEFPPIDPYLCEVEAMEACVLDGAGPVVSLSDSRAFLTGILAINESAKSGEAVKI
jgi:xylose dehydrogenase (NAD/NADP)